MKNSEIYGIKLIYPKERSEIMAITEAIENYLETILILSAEKSDVHAADICAHLGYSRPTVSVVVKNMKTDSLITVDEENHIKLTKKGLNIANSMYERHKIIAKMLVSLGVSEKTALDDACKIEHDISDETFLCIKNHFK